MSHKQDIDAFYQAMKQNGIRPQPGDRFMNERNPRKGRFEYLGKGWLYSVVPVIHVPDARKSTVHLFLTEDKKVFEGKVFHDKKELERQVNCFLQEKPKYASIGVPVFIDLCNFLGTQKESKRHLAYNVRLWNQDFDLRIERIRSAKNAYGPLEPNSDPGLNKAFRVSHNR